MSGWWFVALYLGIGGVIGAFDVRSVWRDRSYSTSAIVVGFLIDVFVWPLVWGWTLGNVWADAVARWIDEKRFGKEQPR